jgi:hypothetical protein
MFFAAERIRGTDGTPEAGEDRIVEPYTIPARVADVKK